MNSTRQESEAEIVSERFNFVIEFDVRLKDFLYTVVFRHSVFFSWAFRQIKNIFQTDSMPVDGAKSIF